MKYDFVFLLNEEGELKNLNSLITSLTGKVTEEKSLGKKELAYPIDKNTSASFYQWTIELPSDKLNDFKKKLSFNEVLIRYLLLRQD